MRFARLNQKSGCNASGVEMGFLIMIRKETNAETTTNRLRIDDVRVGKLINPSTQKVKTRLYMESSIPAQRKTFLCKAVFEKEA